MKVIWAVFFILLMSNSVQAYCGDHIVEAQGDGRIMTFTAGQEANVNVNGQEFHVRVIGVNTQSSTPTATLSINGDTQLLQRGFEGSVGGIAFILTDVQAYTQPVGGGGAVLRFPYATNSEQCDDGNKKNGDGCSAACKYEICGDGFVAGNEECDDGNPNNNDGCNGCRKEFCGDGIKNGKEQCDIRDGVPKGKFCSKNCSFVACGDGIVSSIEICDDGNKIDTDSCTSLCLKAYCGDGFVFEGKEECDDSNSKSGDGCFSCKREGLEFETEKVFANNSSKIEQAVVFQTYCGDNIVQNPNDEGIIEICDDGNNKNGDSCDSTCQKEPYCGDKRIHKPEQCDDGNSISGDGCILCKKDSVFIRLFSIFNIFKK